MNKLIALITFFVAQSVMAHPGHDAASGWVAGLVHPLTGIDHLIALACLGALLADAPPRLRGVGVFALIASLSVGAALGLTGVALPAVEWGIALSVLVAGVMLLRSGSARPLLLVGGTVVFALFHGYAHGMEAKGEAACFVAGFLLSSLVVILMSMVIMKRFARDRSLRIASGLGVSAAGVLFLAILSL